MSILSNYVKKIVNKEEIRTMLGIGPMSTSLIEASLELSMEKNFPLMYIASRNQVDSDLFGSGYVNNWNAKRFVNDIKKIANKINYTGDYFICRDHGGPWQRDEERSNAISRDLAMKIAKKSYKEDIIAGFDLLHIDPTKIPGNYLSAPIDDVINMTVELVEYCEYIRKEFNIKSLEYEVGTEETNGGLTSNESFEYFIRTLLSKLHKKHLPNPLFIVGQTGTLVRKTENVGCFNNGKAKELSMIAAKYGLGFKEHNCDYISSCSLYLHPVVGVTASNVAPEFGQVETEVLLELYQVEKELVKEKLIFNGSKFYNIFLEKSISSGRWKKWMLENINEDDIYNNNDLALEIVRICGHYTFNDENIILERNLMYKNLENFGLNPHKIVLEKIKNSIYRYVMCFNLCEYNLNN